MELRYNFSGGGVNLINFFLVSVVVLEWEEFRNNDLVIVVFLVLFFVIGFVGNGYVFCVYFFWYNFFNYWMFVVVLVLIDFFVCFVVILFEIFDMRYKYIFILINMCKMFCYINYCVVLSLGLMLGVIVVERFWKVCRFFLK